MCEKIEVMKHYSVMEQKSVRKDRSCGAKVPKDRYYGVKDYTKRKKL